MNSKLDPSFLFTVCQVGAEKALKSELARDYPQFKFAFSQPGFITFKWDSKNSLPPDFELKSVFARAYGLSKGQFQLQEIDSILNLAKELAVQASKGRIHLHVWEKDQYAPGEEPMGFSFGQSSSEFESQLRQAAEPYLFAPHSIPASGETVLDIIILDELKGWIGFHIHSGFHSIFPGGRHRISLPQDAPSRAYLKFEEGLQWSGAALRKGDTAIEIGSAPGGTSYALLKRGLKVIGIDPGDMAPELLKNSDFIHMKRTVASVLREELPQSIQWLLLDMNVEPRISLFAVDRLASRMKDTLLGVFLTVKMNQWRYAAEIPSMVEHVKAMGMVRVKVAQLSSHRQEILIFGLTRKGLVRNER